MNPFLLATSGQTLLQEEQYQQLYLEAVQKAIQRGRRMDTPDTLPLDRLQTMVKKHGLESALLHPDDLARLFAGITHAVYHATADLYCSRLGRSIPMVWKLLKEMAGQAQAAPLSYEAIWAVCLSVEQLRQTRLSVTIERESHAWWLGQVALPCTILVSRRANTVIESPLLCTLANAATGQILARRVASQETSEEDLALVIYEAILIERRPGGSDVAGLIFRLPQRLVTACSLQPDCQRACRVLGISIENRQELPAFAQNIQSQWATNLAGRVLVLQQILLLLEAYLTTHVPPGPLHLQEEHARQYGHLLSYQRDAAWHVPLLRVFLPRRQVTTTGEGTLAFHGLQYHDPLLALWSHTPVTVRYSPASDTCIWVYLEGEILCQAYARERRPQEERHRALHAGR